MSGFAGLGASARTLDESRILNGPNFREYFLGISSESSSWKNESIFHPSTKQEVARRTTKAAEDFRTEGRSEDLVKVRGFGSGITKPSGICTFGLALVLSAPVFMANRSSKNPICINVLVDDLDDGAKP